MLRDDDNAASEDDRPSLNLSICYLFHEVEDHLVEVFFRGIMEFPVTHLGIDVAIDSAADCVLGIARAKEIAQMKRLTRLIDDTKEHRENRTYVALFCLFFYSCNRGNNSFSIAL